MDVVAVRVVVTVASTSLTANNFEREESLRPFNKAHSTPGPEADQHVVCDGNWPQTGSPSYWRLQLTVACVSTKATNFIMPPNESVLVKCVALLQAADVDGRGRYATERLGVGGHQRTLSAFLRFLNMPGMALHVNTGWPSRLFSKSGSLAPEYMMVVF
jgi:hypothetical protein